MEEEKKEGEGACQSHVAVHPAGLVTRVLHPNQALIRVPAALGLHRHAKDRWNMRLGVQEPFSQGFQISRVCHGPVLLVHLLGKGLALLGQGSAKPLNDERDILLRLNSLFPGILISLAVVVLLDFVLPIPQVITTVKQHLLLQIHRQDPDDWLAEPLSHRAFQERLGEGGVSNLVDKIASALESLGPGDGTLDYLGLQCLQRLFLVGQHGRYAVAESR